jgi:hypothetical protein
MDDILLLPSDIIRMICDKRKDLFQTRVNAFEKIWIESTGKWDTDVNDFPRAMYRGIHIGNVEMILTFERWNALLTNNTVVPIYSDTIYVYAWDTDDDNERNVDWMERSHPFERFDSENF